MKFQVQTIQQAERDYNGIINYIAQRSRGGAVAWAAAYKNALRRLQRAADTFPLAAEDEFVEFELREALFKTRRGLQYRFYLRFAATKPSFCMSVGRDSHRLFPARCENIEGSSSTGGWHGRTFHHVPACRDAERS